MSTFKALNIESDDESDIEVDDTKELQIEDALKLYQNALKYHAEGPGSFPLAAKAYETLFQSEIFLYPESQNELRRIELYGNSPEIEDFSDHTANVAAPTGALEGGPSTLPQILHLSHKNYGQFKLEYLNARLGDLELTLNQMLTEAAAALGHFVDAIDKDDSDLDLWRRTASVGEMLESRRIARFCLEAVLDGDEETLSSMLSLPGLEEGLAAEQLQALVRGIEDTLSLAQASLVASERRPLSKLLKNRLDLYPQMIKREKALRGEQLKNKAQSPKRLMLPTPKSWVELGESILRLKTIKQTEVSLSETFGTIQFDLVSVVSDTIHPAEDKVISTPEISIATLDRHGSAEAGVGLQHPVAQEPTATEAAPTAAADPDIEAKVEDSIADATAPTEDSPSMVLPTRKRSGDAAGLNDTPETGRAKSKRTRTRESTTAEENKQAMLEANQRWEYEQQLNEVQAADDWMYDTIGNLFERVGVVGLDAAKRVRQEMHSSSSSAGTSPSGNAVAMKQEMALARSDIHSFLNNYSDVLGALLLADDEEQQIGDGFDSKGLVGAHANGSSLNGYAKPPIISEAGLPELLKHVNDGWMTPEDVAWEFTGRMLHRRSSGNDGNSYIQNLWPEDLKTTIVRTLVDFDANIFQRMADLVEGLKGNLTSNAKAPSDNGLFEMALTAFELHLDIYSTVDHGDSEIQPTTIDAQSIRLQRWFELTREAMHFRSMMNEDIADKLNLRFLWATTFYLGTSADVTQDHVLECMSDLRTVFVTAGEPTIFLHNNVVMPELSVGALDREVSKLMTKDFFLKVSNPDVTDPASIIESLEPLLEAIQLDGSSGANGNEMDNEAEPVFSVPQELVSYVAASDLSVRLLLWRRLREAYKAIDYQPMVLSCYFRMINLVVSEMKEKLLSAAGQSDRQATIFRSLALVRGMMSACMPIVHRHGDAMDCIDDASLRSIVATFNDLLQLIQVFNVVEDSIRIGQTQPPTQPNGSSMKTFEKVNSRLHELQLQIWMMMYRLFKEAISQSQDLFPTPVEDRFDFLRCVHRNLGLRGICGDNRKAFVRLLETEFWDMTAVDGYDNEQAQVFYDLYGINCFLDSKYELIEHHCPPDATIPPQAVPLIVDLLLVQAAKLSIKDLIKHPLKDSIDKVHGSASRKRPTAAIMGNREVFRAYLRSPINPLDLYSCLKGEGNELAVATIPAEDALLASKGWYFLMGHIALTKFRSQKRIAPTPTEDVDIAIAFFMQDLEYSISNWETWFRLAQAYDTKVEESVVWSAEKLNNNMSEILHLERAAIHCYTMAMALAYRSADLTFATSEKMTELYYDFAMRIYASSRQPFSMLAFAIDEDEKFLSVNTGIGKAKAFQPLRLYTAWKLARSLFQKSVAGRSQSWMVHFMLGKCLWKMYSALDAVKGRDVPPDHQQVLESFIKAIELIPDKKDSREKREPVLEPHYKLVSIVHKLVKKGTLSLDLAKETLENTPYSRNVPAPSSVDEWVPYVLAIVKNLRTADKSNWHHRLVARAASIVYQDPQPQGDDIDHGKDLDAIGAKHEMTQQMFTKTMVLQVWRPDSERAGRHFVYTARYTRFFVKILEQLKDRANLEMLARRVRRRPHDLFEHSLVWQDICSAYLRLLRSYASIVDGLETSTFSNIAHEDFLIRKDPLEVWMQAQEPGASPALDVLREVQELKKINQSLMKPGPIDDLIGDSYAYLFTTIGKQLWEDERRLKEKDKEEEVAAPSQQPPPASSPPRNPMMSLTHLMNIDGNDDTARSAVPTPAATNARATPQPSDTAAPARRKIGVGRREIRTCAESAYQKPTSGAGGTSATASTTALKPNSASSRIQAVIDASRSDRGDFSAETSAPGSIHDSADDESELSELEEEGEEGEDGSEDIDDDNNDDLDDTIDPSVSKFEHLRRKRLMFPGLANLVVESRATSEGTEDPGMQVQLRRDEAEAEAEEDEEEEEEEEEEGEKDDTEMADVDDVNEQLRREAAAAADESEQVETEE